MRHMFVLVHLFPETISPIPDIQMEPLCLYMPCRKVQQRFPNNTEVYPCKTI